MSDTPKTNLVWFGHENNDCQTGAAFERELALCRRFERENASLRAELAAAQQDAERLDAVFRTCRVIFVRNYPDEPIDHKPYADAPVDAKAEIIAAIDAARKP